MIGANTLTFRLATSCSLGKLEYYGQVWKFRDVRT